MSSPKGLKYSEPWPYRQSRRTTFATIRDKCAKTDVNHVTIDHHVSHGVKVGLKQCLEDWDCMMMMRNIDTATSSSVHHQDQCLKTRVVAALKALRWLVHQYDIF